MTDKKLLCEIIMQILCKQTREIIYLALKLFGDSFENRTSTRNDESMNEN